MDELLEKYELLKSGYLKLKDIFVNEQTGGKVNIKWNELHHNGVMFYPEYERHNIDIKYEDKIVKIGSEAEEFITLYVHPRFDKYRNAKFVKNFFNDWKKLLTKENQQIIKDFNKLDYSKIEEHVKNKIEENKLRNKEKTKEDRELEKEKKEKEIEKYKYATVDDKKIVIDNFLVEPPTIFMGRGNHPKTGSIKKRIYPEDIVLNIGKNMEVPKIKINDEERKWGDVISDNTLEWIASWQNNVTEKWNYTRFGKNSNFKSKSDEAKFDLARKLKRKIKKIREKNEENMKSDNEEIKQMATALYLIDKLAIRIGNEKKSDEADTVGITTLKIKNISLLEGNCNNVKLDFLGKDSIRYTKKFSVSKIVYDNLKLFINKKKNKDDLFDLVTSDSLNKYLKRFMKKLTSKVFRTYNASTLMNNELRKIYNKYKDYEKPDLLQKILYEYQNANLEVAELCNHQKASNNSNTDKVENMVLKIKESQKNINKLLRDKKKKIDEKKKTTAINKRISSKRDKLKLLKNKKNLMEKSKNLSTGTSKTNYIDPRITISFLKKLGLLDKIDKFFSKTQQKQFDWAMDTNENYKF